MFDVCFALDGIESGGRNITKQASTTKERRKRMNPAIQPVRRIVHFKTVGVGDPLSFWGLV